MSPLRPHPPEDDPVLLLVEDNPADARLVLDLLEDLADQTESPWPRHEVRHAVDLKGAITAIEECRPRCVLLDLGLPDASDLQGVNRLLLEDPTLPIVVLTGAEDPAVAARAIGHGAQDFLPKRADMTADQLARAVEHAVLRTEASQAVLESNQALASFAGLVAHDLRSPLSIAKGMLELVRRQAGDGLDPELSMLIDRSVAALKRTSDLVSALLLYAQAKRPDAVIEDVDLTEIAHWAAEAVPRPEDAAVDIEVPLPVVQGAPGALRQVFQNLISNAVKYAAADRPLHVRISARDRETEWEISISDNGPGIPAESREDVFAEGERLGQTGDGFGLGLPAVRAVIDRLGGRVWVDEPDEGPGTAVRFVLPKH